MIMVCETGEVVGGDGCWSGVVACVFWPQNQEIAREDATSIAFGHLIGAAPHLFRVCMEIREDMMAADGCISEQSFRAALLTALSLASGDQIAPSWDSVDTSTD